MAKKRSHPNPEYKTKIVQGLIFIFGAVICIVMVFYMIVDAENKKAQEIGQLKEQVVVLNTEKDAMQRKAAELENQVGRSLDLKKLVNEAERIYGEEEQARREGYLWIDRQSRTMYVTLGALNGLTPGSRLTVYDGNNRVGYVRVETPLDVISYVRLADKNLDDLKSDYYRVVFE